MDELLKDFLVETAEALDSVDLQLVQFEREPQNQAILRNVFRLVHSIKGTCGFLGLQRLENLTHAAESLMGRFRDGALVTQGAVTIILAVIDRIKTILAKLETDGNEPQGSDADLIEAMEHLAHEAYKTIPPLSQTVDTAPATVIEPVESDSEGPKPPAEGTTNGNSIRVNLDTLERLLNLVSELVLTRNQLLEMSRSRQDHALTVPLQRLSLVTAELQESVMQTRMQPIGHAWHKLPRLVRDLAVELRKDIAVVMHGANTELDRQVLDLIKDPLTHLVRNAADHGIEHPEERIMAGKPARATITLNAYHAGGAITIEVSDDGRGLDLDRIRAKAIKMGLVSEAELEKMSDAQISRLIFHPGFSTTDRVTAISGRGVGLDIVQSNVELIGGTIDLRSTRGNGTTFTLRLPLTLAIVPALLVGVGNQRFAIPQSAVVELARLDSKGDARVRRVDTSEMLELRGELLPLASLAEILTIEPASANSNLVVVLAAGARRYAIIVDTIFHTEEIVVKPMASQLRHLALYSGNTILGDGSVVLIVEPNGLARIAGIGDDTERTSRVLSDRQIVDTAEEAGMKILLFRAGKTLTAVPISAVSRLEDIDMARIEILSGKKVLQYGGQLMPVVVLDGVDTTDNQIKPCIVLSWGGVLVGIFADEIMDVVDEVLDIDQSLARPGIVGSAILRDRTIEVLDVVHHMLESAPHLNRKGKEAAAENRVLLIEPSAFFRDTIGPLLRSHGLEVTVTDTLAAALALVASGRNWETVLVSGDLSSGTPADAVIALRDAMQKKSLKAFVTTATVSGTSVAPGFAACLSKFDHDAILAAVMGKSVPWREAA